MIRLGNTPVRAQFEGSPPCRLFALRFLRARPAHYSEPTTTGVQAPAPLLAACHQAAGRFGVAGVHVCGFGAGTLRPCVQVDIAWEHCRQLAVSHACFTCPHAWQ